VDRCGFDKNGEPRSEGMDPVQGFYGMTKSWKMLKRLEKREPMKGRKALPIVGKEFGLEYR